MRSKIELNKCIHITLATPEDRVVWQVSVVEENEYTSKRICKKNAAIQRE